MITSCLRANKPECLFYNNDQLTYYMNMLFTIFMNILIYVQHMILSALNIILFFYSAVISLFIHLFRHYSEIFDINIIF